MPLPSHNAAEFLGRLAAAPDARPDHLLAFAEGAGVVAAALETAAAPFGPQVARAAGLEATRLRALADTAAAQAPRFADRPDRL